MRIIPKKIKVKNTVWKCYSMPDIIVALIVFAIIFVSITAGSWGVAIVMGLAAVIMFFREYQVFSIEKEIHKRCRKRKRAC